MNEYSYGTCQECNGMMEIIKDRWANYSYYCNNCGWLKEEDGYIRKRDEE